MDPPYKTNFAEKSTEIIIKNNLLNEDGIIIIETDTEEKIMQELQNINVHII